MPLSPESTLCNSASFQPQIARIALNLARKMLISALRMHGRRVDDASWARSRGWALSTGLIALPYYLDTNPVIVAMARRQIDEVLADRKRTC